MNLDRTHKPEKYAYFMYITTDEFGNSEFVAAVRYTVNDEGENVDPVMFENSDGESNRSLNTHGISLLTEKYEGIEYKSKEELLTAAQTWQVG